MKARSSSPVHVHVDDSTPVHVHVQRSQSLPSSIERESVLRTSTPDPGSRCLRNRGKSAGTAAHHFHKSLCTKEHKGLKTSSITPRQADKICSVIQSSDVDFGHTDELHPKETSDPSHADDTESRQEGSAHGGPTPEVPHGSRTARDDTALSLGGQDRQRGSRLGMRSILSPSDGNRCSYDDFEDKKLLLKTLIDTEMAANSVAVQLMSFIDHLLDDANFRKSARFKHADERRLSRQKNLLLEKLDIFKRTNQSVRHQLKGLRYHEANRVEADQQVDLLLKKLTQTETENWQLKRSLSEKEKNMEELVELRKREMENTSTAVQLSKSADTVRAHLQGQLRSRESENNRLTVQLRCLERTVTEQKLEVDRTRTEMLELMEKSTKEKEALKKATRAQKRRAERFEGSMERCYSQIRDKDLQVASLSAEASTWRAHLDQVSEEKAQLQLQVDHLKSQITDMTAELAKHRDSVRASSEELLQRMEKLHVEKEELNLDNAALKATVCEMEGKLARSAAALEEQTASTQEQQALADQYHTQVGRLYKELEDVKTRLEEVQRENEVVREQLETQVGELEAYPSLLTAAQKALHHCEQNLVSSERSCSDKSESLRQLQVKAERQAEQLTSSMAMRSSIDDANMQLQLKVHSLQRRTEEIQQENEELVHKLASQEEALQYSSGELDRRTAECNSLSHHLEAALADVKLQVARVKEKAEARERSLHRRILELETERRRGHDELKQLKQSSHTAEKHYEARLRDMQLSLDHSESHKQSIHNYVDFLKSSYSTMFDDAYSRNLATASFLK